VLTRKRYASLILFDAGGTALFGRNLPIINIGAAPLRPQWRNPNYLASRARVHNIPTDGGDFVQMKAKIIITPKKAVVDPQGKTVQNALAQMGYSGVGAVHVGKYLEVELDAGTDREMARKQIDDACHRILSNPVIEDYRFEIE
jgi:phosphoribosylformylglycinamidine synthase subunit PurS